MLIDGGRKISILYILNILKQYTDVNHPMTQQQIMDKLLSDYDMPVDRGTVRSNVMDLIDAQIITGYRTITRSSVNKETGKKEENTIYTDLYYEHDFAEPELHMLIDGLLFSRSVPYQPRKELIEKLGKLSGPYFSQRMKHVHSMNADAPQNPKLFLIIEVLDEAIAEGKQVEIVYGRYGTDLKLHASLNEDGTEKKQLLNPYQLAASDGRYYLICNKDNYNNVANYRVDRIMKIDKLETPAKPGNQVQGLEDGLKLQDYVYQHVNMFSGKPERVEFIIQKKDVGLIVDFFGKHVSFFDRGDGTISCHMKVSRTAMKKFALQFAKEVRVVEPESLVEEIREDIRKINQNYGMDEMKEGDREG